MGHSRKELVSALGDMYEKNRIRTLLLNSHIASAKRIRVLLVHNSAAGYFGERSQKVWPQLFLKQLELADISGSETDAFMVKAIGMASSIDPKGQKICLLNPKYLCM